MLLIIPMVLLLACTEDQVQFTLDDISDPVSLPMMEELLPGTWEGSFRMGESEYTVRFSLTRNEDGQMIGAFSIPQQTQALFIFDDIEINQEGQITFRASSLQTGYTATLRAVQDAQQVMLTGTWKQGGTQVSLTMEPSNIEQITHMSRPQDPVPPYPYVEEEVQFSSPEEGFTLAGTLTIPEGEGPFPAVILLSGSGAHDRNEELFGHRPFLVIADHLTRQGFAVLRYDDRGAGISEGDGTRATSHDLSIDGEGALNYLLSRDEIDPQTIGLIGHSEGGLIAPMIADRRDEVSFLVLLAGPGLPGDQVLLSQSQAILKSQNLPETLIETTLETNKRIYQLIIEHESEEFLVEEIYQVMREVGVTDEQIAQQLTSIMLPWFQFFIRYDPGDVLSNITVPVLALNGSRDLQIIAEENIPAIARHLQEAGNEQFTVRIYPGLNHLFQPARTGMVEEYGTIATTIDPQVLNDISDWIREIISSQS